MKGNNTIAKILQEEYKVKDLTPYEEISYQIENYAENLSRVKITSKTNRNFCCPVYAMFDGYYMNWYGDYGSWGFCCTWKTNVMNLAYNSPYYQLEKLESRDSEEYDDKKCADELIKLIRGGYWYSGLTKEQQDRFNEYIENDYDYIYSDDVLEEYSETCETLKELYEATSEEISYYSKLNGLDIENSDLSDVFDCEQYELYSIGKKAPGRFFIILYMLSVVANEERAKGVNKK